MSGQSRSKIADLKTTALVLRRTNYGESDRILDLLTPTGKVTALAKGARKEKSKLAGGIEMFSVSEVVLHRGRNDFFLLTSAKMKKFYRGILSSLEKLELASLALKKTNRAAEGFDTEEYYDLLIQVLDGLENDFNLTMLETWFYFNLIRIAGEQVNLITDTTGAMLALEDHYVWDPTEKALQKLPAGKISANEIKLMRLMLSAPLTVIARVQNVDKFLPEILYIAKSLNQF